MDFQSELKHRLSLRNQQRIIINPDNTPDSLNRESKQIDFRSMAKLKPPPTPPPKPNISLKIKSEEEEIARRVSKLSVDETSTTTIRPNLHPKPDDLSNAWDQSSSLTEDEDEKKTQIEWEEEEEWDEEEKDEFLISIGTTDLRQLDQRGLDSVMKKASSIVASQLDKDCQKKKKWIPPDKVNLLVEALKHIVNFHPLLSNNVVETIGSDGKPLITLGTEESLMSRLMQIFDDGLMDEEFITDFMTSLCFFSSDILFFQKLELIFDQRLDSFDKDWQKILK